MSPPIPSSSPQQMLSSPPSQNKDKRRKYDRIQVTVETAIKMQENQPPALGHSRDWSKFFQKHQHLPSESLQEFFYKKPGPKPAPPLIFPQETQLITEPPNLGIEEIDEIFIESLLNSGSISNNP